MSSGLNEAWLAEILDEDEVSLSRETFDDIVNRLDERDNKVRQLAEQRAELLEALQLAENIILQEVPGEEYPDAEKIISAAIANATQQRKEPGA